MLQLLIVIATVATGVVLSRPVPTEELLQDRFALGQRYYAANDHENSVEVFSEIQSTPNYALLDVDRIEVAIDDLVLPLRVAATYQLGNSYRNVGRTLLARSRSLADEGESDEARLRQQESLAAFDQARDYYRSLVDDEGGAPANVRVMSQYQIVRASYQTEDYDGVVAETAVLLQRFPGSEYEEAALYDRGWAYYYQGEFEAAIASFEQLLDASDDALKRDRSLFQMGESYTELGQPELARAAYRRLVEQYDFSDLSDKELREMRAQRLRGLVQETTRELVAKAQIRIGDSYAGEGRVDEAIAAYSRVPEAYPEETLIVQKSYDNMATMVLEQQGVDAGLRVLRQAIESVDDIHFRGRAQLRIAGVLFRDGRYRDAVGEYAVYRRAYGDESRAIGIGLDEVLFSEAEAYRELARAHGDNADLRAAQVAYQSILDNYPYSRRRAEARYGLAHVHVAAERLPEAAQAFEATVSEDPRAEVAPHALSWWARIRFQQGDDGRAVALYERLLDEYPESSLAPQAWKDLGLVHKAAGRLDAAVQALAQVDASFSSWPKVQAEAADILLAAGRAGQIDDVLRLDLALQQATASGDQESVAELHYVRGRVARELDDRDAEIEHFTRVLDTSSNPDLTAFSRFFRGIALYQAGSALDAAGDSVRAESRYEGAVADLQAVLDSGGVGDVRLVAFRTRGVALTRLGRSQEAIRTYEELIASAATALERAEFQLMLMELHYDLGGLEQTLAAARELIGADFTEADDAEFSIRDRAYFVLVSVLLEQERFAEAHRSAEAALQRFPRSPNRPALMLVRARALFFHEEYERAARAFSAYVQEYPGRADIAQALYQQGYAHEIVGAYEHAAAAFADVGARFPEHELAAESLYRAGENLYNASRFEPALAQYLSTVERYAGAEAAAKALYSAAWTLLDLDREAESLDAMRQLVRDYPSSGLARYAQFSIGDYYYSKKEFVEARAAYESVVSLFPGTEEAGKAQSLLADVQEDLASQAYESAFEFFQRGDYTAAVDGFEAIFSDYPGSYSALAALANKGVALEHLGNSVEARRTYERVIAAADEGVDAGDISNFARLRLENL